MTLLFVHIPRTAGTTLNSIITRQFSEGAALKIPNYPDPFTARETLEKYRRKTGKVFPEVCRGHFNYGLHNTIPGRYFSMLRDPVERAVSHYWFARWKDSETVKNAAGEFISLEEFVDPNRLGLDTTNIQSRMLVGTYVLFRNCGTETNYRPFASETDLWNATQANLDRFDFIGITERFDQSLLAMKRMFGWQMPVYVSHNAVLDRQSAVEPELARKIQQINAVDVMVYEEVARRLEQTWKRHRYYFFFAKRFFQRAQAKFARTHVPQRVRNRQPPTDSALVAKPGNNSTMKLGVTSSSLAKRKTM